MTARLAFQRCDVSRGDIIFYHAYISVKQLSNTRQLKETSHVLRQKKNLKAKLMILIYNNAQHTYCVWYFLKVLYIQSKINGCMHSYCHYLTHQSDIIKIFVNTSYSY